jgi:hypothetical protein
MGFYSQKKRLRTLIPTQFFQIDTTCGSREIHENEAKFVKIQPNEHKFNSFYFTIIKLFTVGLKGVIGLKVVSKLGT